MLAIELTQERAEVAEIVGDGVTTHCVMAPASNTGYVSFYKPSQSIFAYPLAPGSIHTIAPSYNGVIEAHLGVEGMPVTATGAIVFFEESEAQMALEEYGIK